MQTVKAKAVTIYLSDGSKIEIPSGNFDLMLDTVEKDPIDNSAVLAKVPSHQSIWFEIKGVTPNYIYDTFGTMSKPTKDDDLL